MKLVNLGVNMMVVFTKVMGYHLVHVSYGQVNIGFVSYFRKTAVRLHQLLQCTVIYFVSHGPIFDHIGKSAF